jgi:hypothetical protein
MSVISYGLIIVCVVQLKSCGTQYIFGDDVKMIMTLMQIFASICTICYFSSHIWMIMVLIFGCTLETYIGFALVYFQVKYLVIAESIFFALVCISILIISVYHEHKHTKKRMFMNAIEKDTTYDALI